MDIALRRKGAHSEADVGPEQTVQADGLQTGPTNSDWKRASIATSSPASSFTPFSSLCDRSFASSPSPWARPPMEGVINVNNDSATAGSNIDIIYFEQDNHHIRYRRSTSTADAKYRRNRRGIDKFTMHNITNDSMNAYRDWNRHRYNISLGPLYNPSISKHGISRKRQVKTQHWAWTLAKDIHYKCKATLEDTTSKKDNKTKRHSTTPRKHKAGIFKNLPSSERSTTYSWITLTKGWIENILHQIRRRRNRNNTKKRFKTLDKIRKSGPLNHGGGVSTPEEVKEDDLHIGEQEGTEQTDNTPPSYGSADEPWPRSQRTPRVCKLGRSNTCRGFRSEEAYNRQKYNRAAAQARRKEETNQVKATSYNVSSDGAQESVPTIRAISNCRKTRQYVPRSANANRLWFSEMEPHKLGMEPPTANIFGNNKSFKRASLYVQGLPEEP